MTSGRWWRPDWLCTGRTLSSAIIRRATSLMDCDTRCGPGCHWRYMPNDLPSRNLLYLQAQRWIRRRYFETMAEDLRMLLREFAGRKAQPQR